MNADSLAVTGSMRLDAIALGVVIVVALLLIGAVFLLWLWSRVLEDP